ncbi:MAG: molybdopterin-guanine dinucleotide biosynthesis protein B [Actinomycetota bacterium]|jgi:molybdopterin-guanine dinucleotide biosynthesis protein MobB|nr:molybdopterin-guanine dinucleotide biosynthesis protein B [Actinomycetota bacterium]
METGVPIVAFVGESNSGKTTVVEKVVAELASRGHRVATVKHHVHDFEIDVPGKDSYRHAQAGAVVSMVSAPTKFAVMRKVEHELSIDEIVQYAGDVDILIAEGFKRTARARIEVARKARSTELISAPKDVIALVTDFATLPGVPSFDLDDAAGIAGFLEATFLTNVEGANRNGA